MFKKDAATLEAVGRVEDKMRGDLEKAWWRGLSESEQVCALVQFLVSHVYLLDLCLVFVFFLLIS